MSRFNTATKNGITSPIGTTTPAETALGGAGFNRDPKAELFLLAVSHMANPNGLYHESGKERDERFVTLLRTVAHDTAWVTGFVGFLRNDANMRSASLISAAEIVKARLDQKITGNRAIISAALQRADEPGELLAYWTSKYGRNIPKPVKRGINDAIDRLWNERSYLKWDSGNRGFRMADVVRLTHPSPRHGRQTAFYKHILWDRFKTEESGHADYTWLPTLGHRAVLAALPVEERKEVPTHRLQAAGFTWEAYAGWAQSEMDAAAWEKLIPLMPVMALLRNLRNFDQAKIGKDARRLVEDKLTNPEEIAKSRQLPMRFLSAYAATKNSGTVTAWHPVIEEALNLSLSNVPALKGRTLILVDLSGSMYQSKVSPRSDLVFADSAAVFGAALALKAENADLVGFGSTTRDYSFTPASSLLPLATTIVGTKTSGDSYWGNQPGLGGTDTVGALQAKFRPGYHTRVILATDEQYQSWTYTSSVAGSVDTLLDQYDVPAYTWNLAGYEVAQAQSGKKKRHTFGGLNDASFRMIPLIEGSEGGSRTSYPWEAK